MNLVDLGPLPASRAKRAPVPGHLRAPGRALWRDVLAGYALTTGAQLAQLLIAAEQADLLEDCRAQIEQDGRFVLNRYEERVAHPAVAVAREAARLQLACWRGLELDVVGVLRR